MTHPNVSTALAFTVIDELARNGVRLVVLSPGSRSAAMAIAANEHPDVVARVVIDERSAAFHALGAAKGSGRPVAVLSTSGTATANFFPAVVEADMSCAPLVVLTADRPVELRGVGANQTIDQIELYGSKVRHFAAIEAPSALSDLNRTWRETVTACLAAATVGRPGPVHINIAFREPTVPVTDDGRSSGDVYPYPTGRLEFDLRPQVGANGDMPVIEGSRVLVVAGDGEYDRGRLLSQAHGRNWPVLATALSEMRGMDVVTTYHHLMSGLPDHLRPEAVLAVGSIGPSSRLEDLVDLAAERVRVDRWGRSIDPHGSATHRLSADINEVLSNQVTQADAGWLENWREADRSRRARLSVDLRASGRLSCGLIASLLNDVAWETLVVGSSLPIREVDAHLTRAGRVLANRGASGIDGLVSTALGVASQGRATVAFAGDLSLLHDSNGFLGEVEADICFVIADNDGGGLFDDLPLAVHAPDYVRLFVTPHGRDLGKLAAFHGVGYTEAGDADELAGNVRACVESGGIHIVRVPIERSADREVRAQL